MMILLLLLQLTYDNGKKNNRLIFNFVQRFDFLLLHFKYFQVNAPLAQARQPVHSARQHACATHRRAGKMPATYTLLVTLHLAIELEIRRCSIMKRI